MKLESCSSVADGDAIKEEVSGPENVIACRGSKTDKVKTNIRAVKLESCSSVADGNAIKEEVYGPENMIVCRRNKTDEVKNDIRAVKLESEISPKDESNPQLKRFNRLTMREQMKCKEFWEEFSRDYVMNSDGSFTRKNRKR